MNVFWEYVLSYAAISFLIGSIVHFSQSDWPKKMQCPYWDNVLVGAMLLPAIISLPLIAVIAFFVSIYNSIFKKKESPNAD
jgi:hypothetical protein